MDMLLLYVLCVFNPSDSTQVMCLPLSLIQLLSNNFENSQKGGRWTVKAVAGDKLTIILQLRALLFLSFSLSYWLHTCPQTLVSQLPSWDLSELVASRSQGFCLLSHPPKDHEMQKRRHLNGLCLFTSNSVCHYVRMPISNSV